ncbi:cupin domain-containing protein [Flagellimonas sp.]|uniref:cupin domain-containing protein n=1 Tax=Flagellimonas sp. TaxID=2058762 RepID=UPI003B5B06AE
MSEIDFLIEKFNLALHPEGGYFKESYRSTEKIEQRALPKNYQGDRNHSTCIYFLLTSNTFSAFHKINQDEIWHFYAGSPLKLYIISDSGKYSEHIIGNNFSAGQVPQFVVPGGHWFAAKTIDANGYSFVGCTVAPGFDFADFVLPERMTLIEKFPQHEAVITMLTAPQT